MGFKIVDEDIVAIQIHISQILSVRISFHISWIIVSGVKQLTREQIATVHFLRQSFSLRCFPRARMFARNWFLLSMIVVSPTVFEKSQQDFTQGL